MDDEEELKEQNGDDNAFLTEEQKKQKYKQSIKKEPRLACELSSEIQGQLNLEVANIKQVSVKFYIIDAEILFSRTPFLKTNTEEFSYVKPCHTIDVSSAPSAGDDESAEVKLKVHVPENLAL
jgi:hypothetical protein